MPKNRTPSNGKDTASRSILKLPAALLSAVEKQREAFRQKFGRDPSPNDPLFFDADADTPQPRARNIMLSNIVKALKSSKFAPELIYAFHQTGRLGLAADKSGWSPQAVAEWDAAVEEFRVADPKDAEVANIFCFSVTDAHRMNFSHDYPGFTGEIEFDLEMTLLGERVLRRARFKFKHTPEWEYFDLKKEALFTGWEHWVTGLEIYTVPDPEDGGEEAGDDDKDADKAQGDDDPDDPSPPAWTSIGDLSKDGALPRTVWDRFDELIDERCKAEDIERRRAARY